MKYVLTSGCSFTNNVRLNPNNLEELDTERLSWPYYLQKELGEEYKVLNYGGATNDNVSLCRIFFYHIKRLMSEGINPKDITASQLKLIIGKAWSAISQAGTSEALINVAITPLDLPAELLQSIQDRQIELEKDNNELRLLLNKNQDRQDILELENKQLKRMLESIQEQLGLSL